MQVFVQESIVQSWQTDDFVRDSVEPH